MVPAVDCSIGRPVFSYVAACFTPAAPAVPAFLLDVASLTPSFRLAGISQSDAGFSLPKVDWTWEHCQVSKMWRLELRSSSRRHGVAYELIACVWAACEFSRT